MLGALIQDPGPIRLRRTPATSPLVRLPPGSPADERLPRGAGPVRDEVFGNLYLAERTPGSSARGRGARPSPRDQRRWAVEKPASTKRPRPGGKRQRGVRRDHPRPAVDGARGRAGDSLEVYLSPDLSLRDSPRGTWSPWRFSAAGTSKARPRPVGSRRRRSGRHAAAGERHPLRRKCSTGTPLRQSIAGATSAHPRRREPDLDLGPVLAVPLHGLRRTNGAKMVGAPAGAVGVRGRGGRHGGRLRQLGRACVELAEARAEQQRAVMLDERERIAAALQRPRHPAAVRGRAGAAYHRHAPRGRAWRPDRILRHGRRPGRHHPAYGDQHLPAPAGCRRLLVLGLRARSLDAAAPICTLVLGFELSVRFSGVLRRGRRRRWARTSWPSAASRSATSPGTRGAGSAEGRRGRCELKG